MSITMWLILLVVAFFIDGVIRMVMYASDRMETLKDVEGLWKKQTSETSTKMYGAFSRAVDINLRRFGIVGSFGLDDIELSSDYGFVGDVHFIGLGIIKNKAFVGTDEILSSMQSFVQTTGESFDSTDDAILDKHIVEVFLKEDMSKHFTWDDKDLYNNVEIGDIVALSYSNIKCNGIGFLRKEQKDASNNENFKT